MDKEKAIEIITSLVKGSHKDFTKNGALIFTDQTQLALYIALDALNKINSNDLVQDNFISEISIQNESKLENNISDIIYEKNPSNYLDGNLYERLKKLRKKLAGVSPAYTVFTDSALEFIARELPRNKIEMLRIKGVGERSFENYGEYFSKGKAAVSKTGEYTSHNTERLDVNATKELLLKLDFIEEEISSTKSN